MEFVFVHILGYTFYFNYHAFDIKMWSWKSMFSVLQISHKCQRRQKVKRTLIFICTGSLQFLNSKNLWGPGSTAIFWNPTIKVWLYFTFLLLFTKKPFLSRLFSNLMQWQFFKSCVSQMSKSSSHVSDLNYFLNLNSLIFSFTFQGRH